MPKRQIYLDESKENPPAVDFIMIETEVEFLRHDHDENTKLWVRGKVCDWVRMLYRARRSPATMMIELESPRERLHEFLGAEADKINGQLLTRLIEIIDREKVLDSAHLLFHLTKDDFWITAPSVEHAARWLLTDCDEELSVLIEARRRAWQQQNEDVRLNVIYAGSINERSNLLQKWLFDEQLRAVLGEFPLQLEGKAAQILDDEIGRRLRATNGAAALEFPKKTPNKKNYARSVIEFFSHNPAKLTPEYIAQLSPILSSLERSKLENLLPQTTLSPLSLDADVHTALQWATNEYFPSRLFQLQNNSDALKESDTFAMSFADWVLANYPSLTDYDRESSPINLRTFNVVKKLAPKYWVLWVVVDGLNYPNHQKLLQLLGATSASLRVEQNYPLLAVLPTITEKAKYGLTSGKFPQENERDEWGTQNVFLATFPTGVYAGSAGAAKLKEGLNRETPTVCYWNYTSIDDCFHDETDLAFVQHEVDGQLRSLAGKINQLVISARDPDRVAVIICSDHGQVLGHCRKLQVDLKNQKAHGRTVLADIAQPVDRTDLPFAKNPDGETVFLNPKSFRLSEPTTIALGSTYFVDWGNNAGDEAIGVHGGLFPEEVIVGMSVLLRQPLRKLLTVVMGGAGETGKAGVITLEIDNPNSASVTPLSVKVEGLEIPEHSELLLKKIAPHQQAKFRLTVPKFPIPQTNEEFLIHGILRYEFDDGAQEECAVSGKLVCKSLYSTKNPRLRDRIKL